MKQRICLFFEYYFAWVLFFALQKPIFMLLNLPVDCEFVWMDWGRVIWHGLPLDFSVAGYVSVLWGLLLVGSLFISNGIIRKLVDVYTGLVLLIGIVAFVVDNGLYPYWGFHLDRTLFIYLQTPKDAMASVDWTVGIVGISAIVLLWVGVWIMYRKTLSEQVFSLSKINDQIGGKLSKGMLLIVLTALLFLPIRGSVTVSTMNTGRVYFSQDPFLNIAAVNPVFNLVESLSENTIASARYHYMPTEEAAQIVAEMQREMPMDSNYVPILSMERPKNVILLIMESFSANGIGTLNNGVGVTPEIDRIANQSIVFENAYSSSFRTDRGVVAVMSAFPGQPTSSLMTIPSKSRNLPFFSKELAEHGYRNHFYYGGDEDFTNMRSYLISGGFHDRIADYSFPIEQRLSKWGAHDHIVLDRAAQTILQRQDHQYHFDAILTLSSHEPFEVPATTKNNLPYLNSIAYTDSCIGAFIQHLKDGGIWDSTLVIMIADHGFAYPQNIAYNSPERYHILMMLSGGVIRQPMRVNTLCQQTDLIPTVLNEMNLSYEKFPFSRNIFRAATPWAFYSYNDGFVYISESDTCRVNGKTGLREMGSEESEHKAKAMMQSVYEYIEKL